MKFPLANSIAVIVLAALIVFWFMSLIIVVIDVPASDKRARKILPFVAFLGILAGFDLLQTKGSALVFAVIAFIAFAVHAVVPFMQANKKFSSYPFVRDWLKWSVLVSVIGGIAVSAYFLYVKMTDIQVACGPFLKGCEDVQNSSYATLFGFLPMSVLGLVGYIAILIEWMVWMFGPLMLKKVSALALWGTCIFGVLYSAYLTFLEPFVIGATCMWCISSALFMILLLLASNPLAQEVLSTRTE